MECEEHLLSDVMVIIQQRRLLIPYEYSLIHRAINFQPRVNIA